MKGAIATFQLMVLTIIALLVGAIFLNVAYGTGKGLYNEGIAAKNVAGNPGEITYKTDTIPPITITSPVLEHIYANLGASDPLRPSEVACHIANDIFNDFTANGISNRDFTKSPNSIKEEGSLYGYYYLDSKTFEINKGNNNEFALESDLTSRNCKLCSNGTISNGGVVVPELDEVCINENLDRNVNGINFCHGVFGIPSAAFSNCDCGRKDNLLDEHGNNNIKNWNGYCDGYWGGFFISGWQNCKQDNAEVNKQEFCDNQQTTTGLEYANNMIIWNAEIAGSNGDRYNVSDHVVEKQTNAGAWAGDDYSGNPLDKSPSKYIYGLYWIPESEKYYLFFERIPLLKKETNFDFLINNIYDINGDVFNGGGKPRFSPLGYNDVRARRVMNRIVIPQTDMSIIQLEKDIRDKLNGEGAVSVPSDSWKIEGYPGDCNSYDGRIVDCIDVTTCEGIDCIDYSPGNVDGLWKKYFDGFAGGSSLSQPLPSLTWYPLTFRVKSSTKSNGIRAGNMYLVTLNYWAHPYWNKDSASTINSVDKSIDIYDITENDCCKGSISLSANPPNPSSGSAVSLVASGLNYCDSTLLSGTNKGNVYFYDSPCSGKTPGIGQITSCSISNEQDTFNCLGGDQITPKTVGCTASYTIPAPGTYNFYACTDYNNDGNFNDAGESASTTVNVPVATYATCINNGVGYDMVELGVGVFPGGDVCNAGPDNTACNDLCVKAGFNSGTADESTCIGNSKCDSTVSCWGYNFCYYYDPSHTFAQTGRHIKCKCN